MTIKFKMVDNLTKNLQFKQVEIKKSLKEELENISNEIFKEAQLIVPQESGALAKSGQVTHMEDLNILTSVISYGTSLRNDDNIATQDYAVIKHEMISSMNLASDKWLEKTLLRSSFYFFESLKQRLKKILF